MKTIKDFPNYAVTENGDVYNTNTMKKLKPTKRNGYLQIGLWNGNGKPKIFSIHRLVAMAYIPNENNLPCVNHKDENKENNNVNNLEWCTYKYNNNYGKHKPVNNLNGYITTRKAVYQFTTGGRIISRYISVREAARQTGLNQSNIVKCCLHKGCKTVGGYKWIYEDEVKSKAYSDLLGL